MRDVPVPEMENVSAFWEDCFAGREPGFRIDLKLKFKSSEEGIAFLQAHGISTALFNRQDYKGEIVANNHT